MSKVMHMSKIYAPTLREDPADAEITSHRLLLRAGMISKATSGLYTYLPLGKLVLSHIESIVREEMDDIGAQEILMPVLQPAELWEQSGRLGNYGPELMRLCDRHDHEFCLGPTHEELITALVRNNVRSYRQLPLTLYQIQVKFRDEIRPRFGLLRSREFVMKDAYSFHATQESLQQTYDDMSAAYGRICDRCGLDYRMVEADSGQIGGENTAEFMALADSGEAEIVYCECGYAANTEAGRCTAHPTVYEAAAMQKIATPDVHTIEALAEFLDIPASSTVKALSGKSADGTLTVLFIPGDHELNELKAARELKGFEFLTDDEMVSYGLHKGSMGPVGLPEGVRVAADVSLHDIPQWVVGANEEGFHYVGARLGEDFNVDVWADLCAVKAGDTCPVCGGVLESRRGIEVSQVFQLGDKYSRPLGATFTDEAGEEHPYLMGCYGVGISRMLAAVVEQYNDEAGICWPLSVAPAHVCIIALAHDNDVVQHGAERLAQSLANVGFDVVIDDRDERAGVKFADADLIGWPLQIIIGARGIAEGKAEVKLRRTGEKNEVALSSIADMMAYGHRRMRANRSSSGIGMLDSLFSGNSSN